MAMSPRGAAGDLDYRITLGASVNMRLTGNPMAFRLPCNNLLDIYIVRDFLDERDCRELIALIDANNEPSKLLTYQGFDGDPDYRTSHSCDVDPLNETVMRVESRMTGLMGINPAHGETIQGQRYRVGEQFKPHWDFFHKGEAYWEEVMRAGGQRTWTAMVFLNDVEGGGETNFTHCPVKVTPRRGNLLCWNNMDGIGQPNSYAMHQGMPVTAGTKYIITKWYRERPRPYSRTQAH
jgi:prolyl 4-hydroxylase